MHAMKAATAALCAVCAVTLPASADYLVKEVGSFHVGGRTATLSGMPTREVAFTPGSPALKVDPNGEFEVEQMYVQFVRLAQPKAKIPILFWHGGGLTGATWETKPDGKPGWQQWFLNAGYDVYVSDAVERGRASWARYPEFQERADVPHEKGSLGAVSHRAELRGEWPACHLRGTAVSCRGL